MKSNGPRKRIPEDWNILVDHWYSDDAVVCLFFFLFSIMDHTKSKIIIEKLRKYILDCFQIGLVRTFMLVFCETGIYEIEVVFHISYLFHLVEVLE